MPMRCPAEKAVDQHDLAHFPFDRRDDFVGRHKSPIAQQRHVRREAGREARHPLDDKGRLELFVQHLEARDTVVAAEHERAVEV